MRFISQDLTTEELSLSRLHTHPVITRSVVFATVMTIRLLRTGVSQLSKLCTTSCFVVTSWSNSSIRVNALTHLRFPSLQSENFHFGRCHAWRPLPKGSCRRPLISTLPVNMGEYRETKLRRDSPHTPSPPAAWPPHGHWPFPPFPMRTKYLRHH